VCRMVYVKTFLALQLVTFFEPQSPRNNPLREGRD
jgi:hypothetical protein